jgi:predicted dehydrogenase
MRRIGVGLIGAGKHGARYAGHARDDVPGMTIAALSRRDVEAGTAQAAGLGCRFHADWRDLVVDPAVDAVVAVVPPSLHPDIVAAVARAAKPLLVEKPLATTAAAAAEIVRTVRAADIPCLMAHTLRWNVVVREVAGRLAMLGRLHALVLNQRFERSSLSWLDDPAVSGGGIVLHTGVHSFDLVRFLTGREVTRVRCRTSRVETRRTEDNFQALLELDGSAALVSVSGCRSTGGRSGLIDAACDAGQLVGDHALGFAYSVEGLARRPLTLPEAVPTVREALRSFVAMVEHGTSPPVTVEDGARAVLIAEACRRAAESDTAVAVAPLDA